MGAQASGARELATQARAHATKSGAVQLIRRELAPLSAAGHPYCGGDTCGCGPFGPIPNPTEHVPNKSQRQWQLFEKCLATAPTVASEPPAWQAVAKWQGVAGALHRFECQDNGTLWTLMVRRRAETFIDTVAPSQAVLQAAARLYAK